mgnify:CR=1 FL=1
MSSRSRLGHRTIAVDAPEREGFAKTHDIIPFKRRKLRKAPAHIRDTQTAMSCRCSSFAVSTSGSSIHRCMGSYVRAITLRRFLLAEAFMNAGRPTETITDYGRLRRRKVASCIDDGVLNPAQPKRKPMPRLLSCTRGVKSTAVSLAQPARNRLPTPVM